VTGIGFIRRKETDRIAAVVTELQRLGIHATEDSDGFTVNPGPTNDAIIETYDDHRMAMSMALIGYNRAGVTISDPNCVAKTFPNYFDQMDELRNGISL
jgi:3-phosphoshikimate 1-carboxyvinyltransferase